MEYQENALAKSARRWVLALGIIYSIGFIFALVGIISLIALSSTDYSILRTLGSEGADLIEISMVQNKPLNLAIQGLLIVGQLVAIVLLFRGASSIKKKLFMDKTPFYLLFGILIINNIFNWAIGAGQFTVAAFAVIIISLFLIGIPLWKVTRLSNIEEENRG